MGGRDRSRSGDTLKIRGDKIFLTQISVVVYEVKRRAY